MNANMIADMLTERTAERITATEALPASAERDVALVVLRFILAGGSLATPARLDAALALAGENVCADPSYALAHDEVVKLAARRRGARDGWLGRKSQLVVEVIDRGEIVGEYLLAC
ncbi:hypothetical protein ACFTSD_02540 [Nocardiaceae bacterium NPDC056970]